MTCKRDSGLSVAVNANQNTCRLFRVQFQGEKGMNENNCAYCPYCQNKSIHTQVLKVG